MKLTKTNKKNLEELAMSLLMLSNIGGNAGRYMKISYSNDFQFLGTQHYQYSISWYDKALRNHKSLKDIRIFCIRHFREDYLNFTNTKFKTKKLTHKDFCKVVTNEYDTLKAYAKKYKAIGAVVTCDNRMQNAELTLVI